MKQPESNQLRTIIQNKTAPVLKAGAVLSYSNVYRIYK